MEQLNRGGRLVGLLVLLAAVGSACGSRVPREVLERTNGPVPPIRPPPGAATSQPTVVAAGSASNTYGKANRATPGADAGSRRAPREHAPTTSAPAAGDPARAGEVTDDPITPLGGDPLPAATAAVPGSVPTAPRSLPEILLGSFGTASGLVGRETAPIVVAVRAWSADVNARGGLAGHPLRIVFGDDGGDPNRALAIAKHMVEEDKVAAFVGTYLTITIEAVIPYLEQVQVPVIGGPGGSPIEDRSPVVFNPQTGAGEAQGHAVHLAVVSQTERRKMAILYCTESAACANVANHAKQFAARYGVNVLYEARVSIAQPDFTAEMLAARRAGADVIVTLVDSYGIVRAVRSAHRQNYFPVFSATVAVNTESLTATAASDEIEGILGFAATVPYRTSPKLAAYVEAVKRFVPGGALGGYGATAWVQGKLVERVAREFGRATKPRNTDFLAGLHSLRNESLGGVVPPLTFEDGRRKVNRCGVPIKISGGKITAPLGDTFICAKGP